MRIIAVRHASTLFNEREIINGQIDEGLSPKGFGQIDGLIETLAGYDFSLVYCSTMKRSIQTAEPVAKHYKVPLKKDARLVEVSLGSFEGRGWVATIPGFGMDSSGVLSSCEYDFRPFGGENADAVKARIQSFLGDLKKRPTERPLIVAHGGIMRWFYYLYTGEKTGRIPNLGIYRFEI